MRLTLSVTENSTEYDRMKTPTINGQIYRKGYLYLLTLLLVLMGITQSVRAETITIGKGSGIIWEGMPFNETLSGPLDSPRFTSSYSLLSISNRFGVCALNNVLTNIGGYKALQIAPGVGLIPRRVGP